MSALLRIAVAAAVLAIAMPSFAVEPSPEGAKVYIIWPRDGTVIKGGKFWLRMGLINMGIAPAGVVKADTGHHHLLIDAESAAAG